MTMKINDEDPSDPRRLVHNGEHLTDVENNPYIRPNFAHPNQLGHELIANKLAHWIRNK